MVIDFEPFGYTVSRANDSGRLMPLCFPLIGIGWPVLEALTNGPFAAEDRCGLRLNAVAKGRRGHAGSIAVVGLSVTARHNAGLLLLRRIGRRIAIRESLHPDASKKDIASIVAGRCHGCADVPARSRVNSFRHSMSSSNWKAASSSVPIRSISATAVAPAIAGSLDSSSSTAVVTLVSVSVPVMSASVAEAYRNAPRAEQKQSRSRADAPQAVQVDLVEEALCADLREILGSHVDLSRCA